MSFSYTVKRILLKTGTVIAGVLFFGYILIGDKLENYYGKIIEYGSEKSYSITKFEGIKRKITIPASFKNIPVTEIGDQAFSGSDLIEIIPGLYGPDPLAELKKKAKMGPIDFKKLLYEKTRGKLSSIIMPDGIIKIGDYAFYGNKITSVAFPATLEYIGTAAFSTNELSDVELPPSLKNIKAYAFTGNNIKSIRIGANVIMHINSFDDDFARYYIHNERKAGTYSFVGGEWNYN